MTRRSLCAFACAALMGALVVPAVLAQLPDATDLQALNRMRSNPGWIRSPAESPSKASDCLSIGSAAPKIRAHPLIVDTYRRLLVEYLERPELGWPPPFTLRLKGGYPDEYPGMNTLEKAVAQVESKLSNFCRPDYLEDSANEELPPMERFYPRLPQALAQLPDFQRHELPSDRSLAYAVDSPPMSQQEGATCPYLRQQKQTRSTAAATDGRAHGVLDNLERLTEANELLELAEVLANEGDVEEALECCDRAAQLCPGSPTADRAADTKTELALGIVRPPSGGEESAEAEALEVDGWNSLWLDLFQQMGLPLKRHGEPEGRNSTEELPQAETETGNREMVLGLMKACHLLMSQGMHHEAAELARQAFALDPEFVQADPLIYKMHLLAASPSADTSEASEPPTCPYCGKAAQPIRGIVAEPERRTTQLVPHMPDVDVAVVPALERVLTEKNNPTAGSEEASEGTVDPNLEALRKMVEESFDAATNADGSLRLSVDCPLGGSVLHLRYTHGNLAIWKSPDASTAPSK